MMIFLIGKIKNGFLAGKRFKRVGFSLLEIMVAISILAIGIVAIYKAFFTSLDYLSYLKTRLYANILLDQKFADIEYYFKLKGEIPNVREETDSFRVDQRLINFRYDFKIKTVEQMPNLVELDLSILWQQRNRQINLERIAYLTRY